MNESRLLLNLEPSGIPQLRGEGVYYHHRKLYDKPFNLFLVYHHISDTLWDIPLCIESAVFTQIMAGRVLPGARIMAPLFYRTGGYYTCRGGEGLFNNVMHSYSSSGDLKQVRDSSGNIYYGGFGCIFDKDFHPIIIICRRANSQTGGFENRDYSKVLKINQDIYQHNDRVLEKFILNKMLPLVLREGMFDCVEFSQLDGYVMRPCAGIEETINDDNLNGCLQANLEALLEDV